MRDSEGQESLACCNPWGHKESDMNEQLNNKKLEPNRTKAAEDLASTRLHPHYALNVIM